MQIVEEWTPAKGLDRYWRLGLELAPEGLIPSPHVPARTRWQFLVEDRYPAGDLGVHPARDGGITATFPHQLPNREQDLPWRLGKICTSESVTGHPLAIASVEPRGATDRLAWNVRRALDWVRDASTNSLLKPGDPFELPVYTHADVEGTEIAFRESAADLDAWQRRPQRSGLAELAIINSDGSQLAARTFLTPLGLDVMEPDWGSFITTAGSSVTALWVRLAALPIVEPWEAPRTWGELREVAKRGGCDLDAELEPLANKIRDGRSHYLLLGFPIPAKVAGPPVHLHWIAAEIPPLNISRSKTPVPGFRTQNAHWRADRTIGVLANSEVVRWIDTANWHPQQLSSRGRWAGAFNRSVAVIGGGALGSTFGTLLVRGGTSRMAVIDKECLVGGNVVRHELSMKELRGGKASGLARRWNSISPNVTAHGFNEPLARLSPTARAALDAAAIVIDTTGDDDVLELLAGWQWPSETAFASIAVSYNAEHLYVFAARGRRFPKDAFREAFAPWLAADAPEIDAMTWEGTGCWNPIFPARADDIAAFAALASRHLDVLLDAPLMEPELRVFERADDGTITRIGDPN